MKKIKTHFTLLLLSTPLLTGFTTLLDPTRPPDYTEPVAFSVPQQFTLSAIFYRSNDQLAVVNGQLVRKGDQLGEFTVTTINANTVELTGPKQNRETLSLVTTIKQAR